MAGATRSANFPSPTHHCGSGTLPAARYVPVSASHRFVSYTLRTPARSAAQVAEALNPTDVTIPAALIANITTSPHFGNSPLTPSGLNQFVETVVIRFTSVFARALPGFRHLASNNLFEI